MEGGFCDCDSPRVESFQDTLTKNVFGNVIVWDILGGYLGPGDLKDCRLVCKTFDEKVRSCRRWKEGDYWQLTLNENNWSDPGLFALQVAISTVKVTLSGTGPEETEALDKLSNIFKNIKSLAVDFKDKAKQELEGTPWGDWTPLKFNKLGAFTNATLAVILGHCSSNLTTLTFWKEFLTFLTCCTDNSTILFNCPKTLQRIKGLKTFIVNETKDLRLVYAQRLLYRDHLHQQRTLLLASNLDSVEDLLLKTIGKQEFSPFPSAHLKTLLERRAPALKKLELGEIDLLLISPERLSHLYFPQLSHLSLRVSEKRMSKLCDFISKHTPLQSLTIKVRGLLTKALVNVIAEKSENLSSLKLKFWMMDEGVEWEWLKNCENLSSFSLTNPTFGHMRERNRVRVDIEDLLISMPNGMRKIELRSAGWFVPLRTRFQLLEVLQNPKFSQLEELSILFIPFAVRCQVLEVLGSKSRFPKLRKLHLSHIFQNGELIGENSFWQGLEDVCLRSVSGKISEASLMEKLGESKNLRRLTLRNIPEQTIATAALQSLVKSSTSLESLVINKGSTIGDDLPHRVKTVRYGPEGSSPDDDVDSDSDIDENRNHYFD